MDSSWFMVDDDGHIAEFGSGEEGARPEVGSNDGFYAAMAAIAATGIERAYVEERNVRDGEPPYEDDVFHRGVYSYTNERDYRSAIQPYWRTTRPLRPLTVDELPAGVREQCVRLEGVRFEEAPLLQPFELLPCITYSNQALLSVEDWEFIRWDGATRSYDDKHAAEESYEEIVGRTFRVQPAVYLTALLESWLGGAVPELESWWGAHEFIVSAVLDPKSCALLREALRDHRSRSELEPRVAKLVTRLATPPARAAPRVRLPTRPALTDPNADRRAALESLVSRGALPLSWLSSPSRRFLCDAREWLQCGTLDDLASASQSMSLALAAPELYERLARDLQGVLAVESLVREEHARSSARRGSLETVYWRVASAETLSVVRALVDDTQKSERVRQIEAMGYAMDPAHTRFPTALVSY